MFIRNQEMEFLLLNFRNLQGLLGELEIELNAVKAERPGDDEEIYSRVTKRNIDGMPFVTGRISDRTAAVVLDRSDSIRQMRKAIKEIQDEILFIETVLSKINIGLRILSLQFRAVIEKRYFCGMTLKEISQEMSIDVRSVSRYRVKALEKMTTVTRITLDDHQKIRELLEGVKIID